MINLLQCQAVPIVDRVASSYQGIHKFVNLMGDLDIIFINSK